jgi:peptidase E
MVNIPKQQVSVLSIGLACASHNPKIQESLGLELSRYLRFVNPHKEIHVDVAYRKALLLKGQIEYADVIYVHGGNGDELQDWLGVIHNLKDIVSEDKICAGSSAGANMWANCYYSNDNQSVCSGLNVIPVKTFCHYNSSKWKKANELIQTGDTTLPLITLVEGEYVTYENS